MEFCSRSPTHRWDSLLEPSVVGGECHSALNVCRMSPDFILFFSPFHFSSFLFHSPTLFLLSLPEQFGAKTVSQKGVSQPEQEVLVDNRAQRASVLGGDSTAEKSYIDGVIKKVIRSVCFIIGKCSMYRYRKGDDNNELYGTGIAVLL